MTGPHQLPPLYVTVPGEVAPRDAVVREAERIAEESGVSLGEYRGVWFNGAEVGPHVHLFADAAGLEAATNVGYVPTGRTASDRADTLRDEHIERVMRSVQYTSACQRDNDGCQRSPRCPHFGSCRLADALLDRTDGRRL